MSRPAAAHPARHSPVPSGSQCGRRIQACLPPPASGCNPCDRSESESIPEASLHLPACGILHGQPHPPVAAASLCPVKGQQRGCLLFRVWRAPAPDRQSRSQYLLPHRHRVASGPHAPSSAATSSRKLLGKPRLQQGARHLRSAGGNVASAIQARAGSRLVFHRPPDRRPRAHTGFDTEPIQHFQRGLADTA